jgi:hypothetical protein
MYHDQPRSLSKDRLPPVRSRKRVSEPFSCFRSRKRDPVKKIPPNSDSHTNKRPRPSEESDATFFPEAEDTTGDTDVTQSKNLDNQADCDRDKQSLTQTAELGVKNDSVSLTSQGLQVGPGRILSNGVWTVGQVKIQQDGIEVGKGRITGGMISEFTLDSSTKVIPLTTIGTRSQEVNENKVEYGGSMVPEGVTISPSVRNIPGRSILTIQYVRGPTLGINAVIPDISNAVGVFIDGMVPVSPNYLTGSMYVVNPGWFPEGIRSSSSLLWGMYQEPNKPPSTPFWVGYLDFTVWTNEDDLVITYVERLINNIQHNTRWAEASLG